ncbi:hypothetical protein GOBAR_DD09862 [Gossypium barbadense]|nr:hypothetical protein GOBAR_DD09862 [Gossypium barbadense]
MEEKKEKGMAFRPYCPVGRNPGEALEGSCSLGEWRTPPTIARGLAIVWDIALYRKQLNPREKLMSGCGA